MYLICDMLSFYDIDLCFLMLTENTHNLIFIIVGQSEKCKNTNSIIIVCSTILITHVRLSFSLESFAFSKITLKGWLHLELVTCLTL